MELEVFTKNILAEAFCVKPSKRKINKLIVDYFLNKPIPTVEANYGFLGRCRYNKNGEVFNNVTQLSYNPVKAKIGLQRCNLPKQQVFYGALPTISENASLLSTAIVETCMEYIKDDSIDSHYLTLSRWQIKRPLNVFMLPHSKKCQLRNSDFKEAGENFNNIIYKMVGENFNTANHFIESLEFISDVFCEIDNKYKYYFISAAYYNFILHSTKAKDLEIDGLIYPSANTEAAGINIVLKHELIDNNIVYCDKVIMYTAKRSKQNQKNFTGYDVSDEVTPDENGKFRFSFIR